jgi:hypothetical protein
VRLPPWRQPLTYTFAVTFTGHNRYMVLRRFGDLPKALAAKSALDASGIDSFVADENTSRMILSNLGGIRLFVRQSDVEAATAVLSGMGPRLVI